MSSTQERIHAETNELLSPTFQLYLRFYSKGNILIQYMCVKFLPHKSLKWFAVYH